MGSLNCDLCDLGIIRIERGRESEFPPTKICTHFRDFALKENKLTFLWELLYPIKIPCWGALLGPV